MLLTWAQRWSSGLAWGQAWAEPAFGLALDPAPVALSGGLFAAADIAVGVAFDVAGDVALAGAVSTDAGVAITAPVDGLDWAQAWSTSLAWRQAWSTDATGRFTLDAQPLALAGSLTASGDVAAMQGSRWYFEAPIEVAPVGGVLGVSGAITITRPTTVDFALSGAVALAGQMGVSGGIASAVPHVLELTASVGLVAYMGAASNIQQAYGRHLFDAQADMSGVLAIEADIGFSTRAAVAFPLAGKRQAFPLAGKRQF